MICHNLGHPNADSIAEHYISIGHAKMDNGKIWLIILHNPTDTNSNTKNSHKVCELPVFSSNSFDLLNLWCLDFVFLRIVHDLIFIPIRFYIRFLSMLRLVFFVIWLVIKGQLISKCPFGVFKSSKKPTKFFPGFLP